MSTGRPADWTVTLTSAARGTVNVVDGCGDLAVDRTRRILGPDGDPRVGELVARGGGRA
jgi:hypothetical protein